MQPECNKCKNETPRYRMNDHHESAAEKNVSTPYGAEMKMDCKQVKCT